MKYLLLLSLLFLVPIPLRAMEASQEQCEQTNNPFNLLPNEIFERILEIPVREELPSLLMKMKTNGNYPALMHLCKRNNPVAKQVPIFAITDKRFLGLVKNIMVRIAQEPAMNQEIKESLPFANLRPKLSLIDHVSFAGSSLERGEKKEIPKGFLFAISGKNDKQYEGFSFYEFWLIADRRQSIHSRWNNGGHYRIKLASGIVETPYFANLITRNKPVLIDYLDAIDTDESRALIEKINNVKPEDELNEGL